MYAIVQTGGKQYRVSAGDVISVEKLYQKEAGDSVTLDKVLIAGEDGKLTVGTPYIDGASVEAEVVENGKGKKVIIFKYKAKKDYRKKQGHRQPYTKLEIKAINVNGQSYKAAPKAEVKETTAEAPEVKTEEPKTEKKVNLKSMKKAELIEFAKENNIELNEKATNADMIATIEAAMNK